jgi:hypothetical protein
MQFVPVTITAEMMTAADGRPVAYIDATAVAVFTYQDPRGVHVIDIHLREDIPPGRLRLLLNGQPLATTPTPSPARSRRRGSRLIGARHDHHQPPARHRARVHRRGHRR